MPHALIPPTHVYFVQVVWIFCYKRSEHCCAHLLHACGTMWQTIASVQNAGLWLNMANIRETEYQRFYLEYNCGTQEHVIVFEYLHTPLNNFSFDKVITSIHQASLHA